MAEIDPVPSDSSSPGPRVVAGVDGSAASAGVVETAYEEARRRGAVLEVVHVWSFPVYATAFVPPVPVPPSLYSDAIADAQAVLDTVVAGAPNAGGVTVTGTLVEGHPPRVLVDHSRGADLLVVGRRGHSRIAELLLGSTSRACVEHAHCPVLVVPPRQAHEVSGGSLTGVGAAASTPR